MGTCVLRGALHSQCMTVTALLLPSPGSPACIFSLCITCEQQSTMVKFLTVLTMDVSGKAVAGLLGYEIEICFICDALCQSFHGAALSTNVACVAAMACFNSASMCQL